uniref:Uncharacterized protein LOC104226026 n=1 Tax=Nicotiana sylvestris TaxID=4096 RepID=A0A1U7WC39_NICSY|nr:PREDICTED: uncharacterized protein LOC104226026 [Nicotiana sylvestris]
MSGQVEVSDREVKQILEKIVNKNRKDWVGKLDDTLWGHIELHTRPPYIGTSPYKLVYGKVCHLPVKLEHKAYWAIKKLNMDMDIAVEKRLLQLNELDEFRLHAYENVKLYKEKTKRWHEKHIQHREFELGKEVLLLNSRLKLFPGKINSRWSGLFIVVSVRLHEAVELRDTSSCAKNRQEMNPRCKSAWPWALENLREGEHGMRKAIGGLRDDARSQEMTGDGRSAIED